jgi:hypothetical protein
MRMIELTRGQVAKVSDRDYPRLAKYKWYAQTACGGGYYAVRHPPRNGAKTQTLLWMHREILSARAGAKAVKRLHGRFAFLENRGSTSKS